VIKNNVKSNTEVSFIEILLLSKRLM